MAKRRVPQDSLFDAILSIASDFSLSAVLQRITEAACTLVDARYGALGVIGEDRMLSDFIPVGIDAETIKAIGHLPEGHGILGLLVIDPKPLRLRDLTTHPDSFGFPEHHPPMKSFLGVPVKVRDTVFGNLYLCEKRNADEFTQEDEDLVSSRATRWFRADESGPGLIAPAPPRRRRASPRRRDRRPPGASATGSRAARSAARPP